MSRAFVKEPDGEAGDDQPELPISAHPNYVTQAGLAGLGSRRQALEGQRGALKADEGDLGKQSHLAQVERELRYVEARVKSAILVDPAQQAKDEVAFGAIVTLEDEDGERREVAIVGEDEAEPTDGKIAWPAPLARALTGAEVGDLVTWKRPSGDLELEVIAIRYPAA